MREPLEIPDRAWGVAAWSSDTVDAVQKTAPIIVATELRRLAERGLQSRHDMLRRANELDPEGSDADPA